MSGGEISGNTASFSGGGVCVYGSGTFAKSGDSAIYGSDADTGLKNTARANNYYGHAVYVDASPVKIRNTTAGSGVSLDSSASGAAGG
jgi:hypothetical protein